MVVVVLPDALPVGEEAGLLVDAAARGVHQVQHRFAGFEGALLHPEELLDALRRHRPALDRVVVGHEVDVPALELRGAGQQPVGRQLVVGVELRELAVLERQSVRPEPQLQPVPDEQLSLLRQLLSDRKSVV